MRKKGINRREIRRWLAEHVKPAIWRAADKDQWVREVVNSLMETGDYELKARFTRSGHPITWG